jgi:hypothetical protein
VHGCRPRRGSPRRGGPDRASFAYTAPAPTGRAAPSDDDYKAVVISSIHVQAAGVQNIGSLISVTLDLSSSDYALWRNNVLLTLWCYSLFDRVLLDTTYVSVPALDRINSVIKSWI